MTRTTGELEIMVKGITEKLEEHVKRSAEEHLEVREALKHLEKSAQESLLLVKDLSYIIKDHAQNISELITNTNEHSKQIKNLNELRISVQGGIWGIVKVATIVSSIILGMVSTLFFLYVDKLKSDIADDVISKIEEKYEPVISK